MRVVEGAPVQLKLEPQLPLGARVMSGSLCGRRSAVHVEKQEQDQHAMLNFVVPQGTCEVSLSYRGGIGIVMPPSCPQLGGASTGPELTSVVLEGDTLHLGLDTIPSRENHLWIYTPLAIATSMPTNVRKIGEDVYELKVLPTENSSSYQHLQISLALGKLSDQR